jgi:hypothetical protein
MATTTHTDADTALVVTLTDDAGEIELIADTINHSNPADLLDSLTVVAAEPPR